MDLLIYIGCILLTVIVLVGLGTLIKIFSTDRYSRSIEDDIE
jgi:hypothetical protein